MTEPKAIRMIVKRVQYQEVIVSKTTHDMPKTAKELVETVTEMRTAPWEWTKDEMWSDENDEMTVETWDVD